MKPLTTFGVTFVLLLASATTVTASPEGAGPGAMTVAITVTAPRQPVPTADILRGPYEWASGGSAVADVLREGYGEDTSVAATSAEQNQTPSNSVADVVRGPYEAPPAEHLAAQPRTH